MSLAPSLAPPPPALTALSSNPSAPPTPLPHTHDAAYFLAQSRWIRDNLDPQIARNGPDALHSDDLLNLDEFLRRLLHTPVPLPDIRQSRLHLAILLISGQATRWPKKLIERADALKEAWETGYGLPLRKIGTLLYEVGGRLHGICKVEDLSREKLIVRWLKSRVVKLSPLQARRVGDLGFKAGDWWINALFAFKDGIIDSAEPSGGIVADAEGAYAILMTSDEEVSSETPEAFTYRARSQDRGRYRLASATPASRLPVRILRAHSLRSFWAPKAGVRYEGLHIVTGWCIKADAKTGEMVYEIQFKRMPSETKMEEVMKRPFSDEVEDYREYKRLRQVTREKQEAAKEKARPMTPAIMVSSDGAVEDDDGYDNAELSSPYSDSSERWS